jgi:mono/diheme cytochrome c family protein
MTVVVVLFVVACAPVPAGRDAGADAGVGAGADDGGLESFDAGCLPAATLDAQLADAGRAFLFGAEIGGVLVPRAAFDNLWLVWGTGAPADPAAAMRQRYGFAPALTPNDGLPMGFRLEGANVRVSCLVCHAGEVAGQTVVGAANTRLDLELFVDDLKTLARNFGQTPPSLSVRTGARGVSDIIGMTLQMVVRTQQPPLPINTEIGFQDSAAWWTLATKTRLYADGNGPTSAHRTMMATQLAFGADQRDLERLEPGYVALREYLLSLTPPAWPFAAPAADAVSRGQQLFRSRCTSCHADDRCVRADVRVVDRATVGTDPERSLKYTVNEIALINNSWFGAVTKHEATTGYLAQSLRGVWASAPYFHNGSVPTLEAVLDSSKRPRFFRLLGSGRAEYDEAAVGLKVEVLQAAPVNAPRAERAAVYDTTKPGLGNGGHLYGDALTPGERSDLLAFLQTL